MNKDEMKLRTKSFGLRVMKLVRELPTDIPGKVIANQLMRSASSVGANYRSACRARSTAEFIAKLGIVLEEADESGHWLELIIEDGMLTRPRVEPLRTEADELCAIIYSAIHSTRTKQ
jgi:four helix bundle protein